jgi:hypothetical protein
MDVAVLLLDLDVRHAHPRFFLHLDTQPANGSARPA